MEEGRRLNTPFSCLAFWLWLLELQCINWGQQTTYIQELHSSYVLQGIMGTIPFFHAPKNLWAGSELPWNY